MVVHRHYYVLVFSITILPYFVRLYKWQKIINEILSENICRKGVVSGMNGINAASMLKLMAANIKVQQSDLDLLEELKEVMR